MAVTETGAYFNIGRVIQLTFALVGRNFVPFSLLSLLLAGVPYLLLLLIVPAAVASAMSPGGPSAGSGMSTIAFVVFAVYFLGALILQAALTRASVDDLSRKTVSISAALGTGIAVLLPMLGLMLIFFGVLLVGAFIFGFGMAAGAAAQSGVVMGVATIAVIAGAVYLIVRWLVSAPVLVVERPGVFASLRRSTALTKSHRWAILGLLVLYALFLFVLQLVIALVMPGAGAMMSGTSVEGLTLVPLVLLVLLQSVITMFITAGIASIYFELRQIKDGVGVSELADVFA
jgi:hypothetical protein